MGEVGPKGDILIMHALLKQHQRLLGMHVSEPGLLGLSIPVVSSKIPVTRIVVVSRQVLCLFAAFVGCASHNPRQNPSTILVCLGAEK